MNIDLEELEYSIKSETCGLLEDKEFFRSWLQSLDPSEELFVPSDTYLTPISVYLETMLDSYILQLYEGEEYIPDVQVEVFDKNCNIYVGDYIIFLESNPEWVIEFNRKILDKYDNSKEVAQKVFDEDHLAYMGYLIDFNDFDDFYGAFMIDSAYRNMRSKLLIHIGVLECLYEL